MSVSIYAFILLSFVSTLVAPPVNPEPPVPREGQDPNDDASYLKLEYRKYLEEVVAVLEDDEDFKRELDAMGDDALEEGAIAHYLQFANKNTRTKLDELKRLEIRRLKDLHKKMMREFSNEARKHGPKVVPVPDAPSVNHLDDKNPHSFEMEDLQKLIKKTTDDLKNLDEKRKNEFKQYEMQKEHEYREKQKDISPEELEKLKQEHVETEKRHKDHPKMHHPGDKEQLEEVWKEDDHMDQQEFDPRTFFLLHDLDGDGFWDIPELEALFQRELDKVYNNSNPDDDMVERDEEMNRMREHVFNEIDKDGDNRISWEEFEASTKTEDFEKDEGWDGLDEQDLYDEEEMKAFEAALAEQEQKKPGVPHPNQAEPQPPAPPADQADSAPKVDAGQPKENIVVDSNDVKPSNDVKSSNDVKPNQ